MLVWNCGIGVGRGRVSLDHGCLSVLTCDSFFQALSIALCSCWTLPWPLLVTSKFRVFLVQNTKTHLVHSAYTTCSQGAWWFHLLPCAMLRCKRLYENPGGPYGQPQSWALLIIALLRWTQGCSVRFIVTQVVLEDRHCSFCSGMPQTYFHGHGGGSESTGPHQQQSLHCIPHSPHFPACWPSSYLLWSRTWIFMTSHTPLCGYGINIMYSFLQLLALEIWSQTLGIKKTRFSLKCPALVIKSHSF